MKDGYTYDEKALIARFANGDNEAFNALFLRYWDHVYSVALIMTKSPSLADDISQEVFLALLEERATLSKMENFKGFLYALVKYRVHNKLRRMKVEDTYQQYLASRIGLTQIPAADNRVNIRELQETVQKGIELLPPQQKRAFQLSRQEGMTHAQIGQEMGISPKTVKDYIVRAIAFLRKFLHDQGILVIIWTAIDALKKFFFF